VRSGGGSFSGGGSRSGGSFSGGGTVRSGGFSGGSMARGSNVITRGGGGVRVGGTAFRGNTIIRGGNRFGNRFYGGRDYYPSFYGGFGFGFGYGYPYYYPYSSYYPYSYDPYYYGSSYGAPYYDNGYYDNGYCDGNAGYVQQAPPAAPSVINQNIGTPGGTSSGSFYRAADYYLIAFNDHTIRAAVSYTVEGDEIRYTTREHEEKTAPLASVDVRFSEQINRDRRVEFRLP
jgi:hypothetical protein